jgi:hypothetical protein
MNAESVNVKIGGMNIYGWYMKSYMFPAYFNIDWSLHSKDYFVGSHQFTPVWTSETTVSLFYFNLWYNSDMRPRQFNLIESEKMTWALHM